MLRRVCTSSEYLSSSPLSPPAELSSGISPAYDIQVIKASVAEFAFRPISRGIPATTRPT